eukprot:93163-Hanusia_phi.AAC.1
MGGNASHARRANLLTCLLQISQTGSIVNYFRVRQMDLCPTCARGASASQTGIFATMVVLVAAYTVIQ